MVFYEFKKLLKKNGKEFIKQSIDKFDIFNNGKLSKKSIGEIVRVSHFSAPFSIIILLLFSSKSTSQMLLTYLIMIAFAFLIFDGCFLTIIEQHYCNDNFTIMDPCLELSNMEKTNKNRFLISIPLGLLFMTTSFFIYCVRFVN